MAEIKFLEILNDLSPAFISGLQNAAGREVAEQIGRVIIPVQKIGGVPEYFSVMSFPYPRLTPEDLKDMPLVEAESYVINVGEVEFKIDVDHFGQINWVHIREAPNIYETLKIQLSRVAETGDYTEFWKH